MSLPPLFLTGGPFWSDALCWRCGKPLKGGTVKLELDDRVDEMHDFGGVPKSDSRGWFNVGPDCAEILRKRARVALEGGDR